mgnify:CR=1 FL=1
MMAPARITPFVPTYICDRLHSADLIYFWALGKGSAECKRYPIHHPKRGKLLHEPNRRRWLKIALRSPEQSNMNSVPLCNRQGSIDRLSIRDRICLNFRDLAQYYAISFAPTFGRQADV